MKTIALIILFCFACCAEGAEYWVDGTLGDDSNPGTEIAPWKTIGRAKATSTSDPNVDYGDTVYLRDGDYGKFWINQRNDDGTTNTNNKLPAYGGSMTEELGGETSWTSYIAETGQDSVVIESIKLGDSQGPYLAAHIFTNITVEALDPCSLVTTVDTPDGGDPNKIFTLAAGSGDNDFYNDWLCVIIEPNHVQPPVAEAEWGFHAVRQVYDYVGATKEITLNSPGFDIDPCAVEAGDAIYLYDQYHGGIIFAEAVGFRLNNVTLTGSFIMVNALSQGIQFSNQCNDAKIDNCTITYVSNGIIGLCNNLEITNCDISYTGIDRMNVQTSENILIEGNTIHSDYMYRHYHADQLHIQNNIENLTISKNIFHSGPSGMFVNTCTNPDANNILIENNLIHSHSGYELNLRNWQNLTIRHNTFVGSPATIGLRVADNNNGIIAIYNNLFITPYWIQTADDVAYHDYNVAMRIPNGELVIDSETNSYFYDTNDIDKEADILTIAAELCNNPDADNYTHKPGSRAINFGTTSQGYPSDDILGNPRDASPDAGCHEYTQYLLAFRE